VKHCMLPPLLPVVSFVGFTGGNAVGLDVGLTVGLVVGLAVGVAVGCTVGLAVGFLVRVRSAVLSGGISIYLAPRSS